MQNEDLFTHVIEKSQVTRSSGKAITRSSNGYFIPLSCFPHFSIFWLCFLLYCLYSPTEKTAISNSSHIFYQLSK